MTKEDAERIKKFEPLFGIPVIDPSAKRLYNNARVAIGKFGNDGGFVMNYICGVITLDEYTMQCDIMGCDDYNMAALQSAAEAWEYFVEWFGRNQRVLSYSASTQETFGILKTRYFQFKYELSQLQLDGIDNI